MRKLLSFRLILSALLLAILTPPIVLTHEGVPEKEKQKRPKGLPNIGNTCYMNGALQALYATNLKEKLAKLIKECTKTCRVAKSLNTFFERYLESPGDVLDNKILQNIYEFFTHYPSIYESPGNIIKTQCGEYDDTAQFIEKIQEHLNDEFKQYGLISPLSIELDITRSPRRITHDVILSLRVRSDVAKGIHDFMSTSGGKGYLKPSDIVTILNNTSPKDEVIEAQCRFPLILSLTQYLSPESTLKSAEYQLKSIVFYKVKGQHFTSGVSLIGSTWYFCNDSIIKEFPSTRMQTLSTEGYFEDNKNFYVPNVFLYERIDASSTISSIQQPLTELSQQLTALADAVSGAN